MKNHVNMPQLRFPVFNDEWEQFEFGTLFSERNERGKEGLPILTVSIHDGVSDGELDAENLGKQVRRSEDKSSYKRVYPGDLVLNMMRAWQGAIGVVMSEGMVSPAYITATPSEDVFPPFLDYVARRKPTIEQISQLSYGVTDFRKRLYWDSFVRVKCKLPKKTEQERIWKFLNCVDSFIETYENKINRIKTLKKGLLQKMFPKEGMDVPEIRFPGFSDAWEQRKLGDVLRVDTRRNGDTFAREDVLSVSDEFGCVNQIRFQGRSFAGEDISNYKIVDAGDIIYTRSPLQAKPYGIIKVVRDETGIVSPLYIVNKATEGNDAEFIYRVFDLPYKTNNYLSPLVRKGAKNTMNISEDEWLSGDIVVSPNYEEQKIIGVFFKHLDNLITLHQRKLELMKKYKKGLMQQLFA